MTRSLLLLLTCLLPLTACCAAAPPAESTDEPLRLRVLTYNIHHGEGEDGVFDYNRLADIIKLAGPDLVALQEVDRATGRSSGVDQAAKLGELTGMYHYFAEAMPYDGGGYGEAILSKTPIQPELADTIALRAERNQEPRAVAVAEVRPWGDDGPSIVFAGTHLCHQSAKTRLNQAKQINDELVLHPTRRGIIAGDFNFTEGTDAYNEIARRWTDTALIFGDPQPTIPSDSPRRRIDFVFARPAGAWDVIDVQVLDEPVASDHAPVLVVLDLVSP